MSWGKIQKGKYRRIQENIFIMNRTTSEENFLDPGKSVSSA